MRQHVDKRQTRADVVCLRLGIAAEIYLVENDDRHGTRFTHDGQITFDAARVQIFGKRGHEKNRVHVGRDDLFFDGPAGRLPGIVLMRSRRSVINARSAPVGAVMHTQSPTAGKSAAVRVAWRNLPLTSAHPSKSPATL